VSGAGPPAEDWKKRKWRSRRDGRPAHTLGCPDYYWVQLGEICLTESTCSVGPELELDMAPPALSNLPLISTLLFTYFVMSDLLPPVSLYWLAEELELAPAVPAAPPAAAPAPLLEPDPTLAFARMKLSDLDEDAAPPAAAPPAGAPPAGAPPPAGAVPLVPVADEESACRQPVTVTLLLLLSSFALGA